MKKKISLLFIVALQLLPAEIHAQLAETKLTPSNSVRGDWFGRTVAVSGDYAISGAQWDKNFGDRAGAAYIFKRSGNEWIEQAKLTPSTPAVWGFFGLSVAIDGDYAIVGQSGGSSNMWLNTGAAYIFVRNGQTWTEQAKLIASDGRPDDSFGNSVAISGKVAIIGAKEDDKSGSAYVFVQDDGAWTEQAKLIARDAHPYDSFGSSVSIDGDYAVIGAESYDSAGGQFVREGAAYIFKRNGNTWTEQAKLTTSDPASMDYFGRSVSISGDFTIVGAFGKAYAGRESGAAYVFVRKDTTWSQQARLTASDARERDFFGSSVSISNEIALVGAEQHGGIHGKTHAGSAYLFVRNGNSWTEKMEIKASDAWTADYFGKSVSINGSRAIVGAFKDGGTYHPGAAYVYSGFASVAPMDGTWETRASLNTRRTTLSRHAAVVGGEIYVVGGFDGTDSLTSVEAYDPATDRWSFKASLDSGLSAHDLAVVNNKIYAIGGTIDWPTPVAHVFEYDHGLDKWQAKASMPTARKRLTTAVVDNRIYAIGGENDDLSLYHSTVELYDPESDTWTEKASMHIGKSSAAASVIDGKIFVLGGWNQNGPLSVIEVYDPVADIWEVLPDTITARGLHTSAVLGGKIYLTGGTLRDFVIADKFESFNPVSGELVGLSPMQFARTALTSAVVDGKFYAIGGRMPDFSVTNVVEVYTPPTSTSVNSSLAIPSGPYLAQNYPNPFNPSTNIRYELPNAAQVSVVIYSVLGEKVSTLIAEQQPAGAHAVQWDGRNAFGRQVATGLYFYRLEASDIAGKKRQFVETRKMLLMR